MTTKSDQEVSIADVKLFREATGCPFSECVSALNSMDLLLRERVLLAAKTQQGIFYDPIEDEPEYATAFATAADEAKASVQIQGLANRRGSSHLLWAEKAKILRERFDIQWFSPREMNPFVTFD